MLASLAGARPRRGAHRFLMLAVLAASSGPALRAQNAASAPGLALSDSINKQIPRWLRLGGEYRSRLEGLSGGAFRSDNADAYLLGRLRINIRLEPARWMRVVFQGQDARVYRNSRFAKAPPYQNGLDLRQGYVELGDAETRAVSVRAGRQELAFGEQRLAGPSNWSNTARTFDALRLTLRRGRYRLDAFAAAVVVAKDGEFDRPVAGSNLHGLYGAIEKPVPNAVLEPYVFWRLAPRLTGETGRIGGLDFKTVGARWAGKLPAAFDYSVEMAGQAGRLAGDRVRAWAGHWLVGRGFAAARYRPRLYAEYNYASGDRDPRDGTRGTFDSLYPTSHDKWGMADQVGWRNIHDLRGGVEAKPRPKWTLAVTYHSWWLASARDGLYNAGGALVARAADGTAGRHVGQEVDGQAVYAVSRQIQIGAGMGHIFPGRFLRRATPGRAYTYPYVMLTYAF